MRCDVIAIGIQLGAVEHASYVRTSHMAVGFIEGSAGLLNVLFLNFLAGLRIVRPSKELVSMVERMPAQAQITSFSQWKAAPEG